MVESLFIAVFFGLKPLKKYFFSEKLTYTSFPGVEARKLTFLF
jgi:hypothetical protein